MQAGRTPGPGCAHHCSDSLALFLFQGIGWHRWAGIRLLSLALLVCYSSAGVRCRPFLITIPPVHARAVRTAFTEHPTPVTISCAAP